MKEEKKAMEIGGDEEGTRRRIKLFCPSASRLLRISAADGQKLDLGSIARAFGLDPSTVRLNGHFISRGVHLVASSVTWRSLIGFFSARGLSTGADGSGALVVDGRFRKIGPKRSHYLEDDGDGIVNAEEQGSFRENKRPQHEHCSVFSKEKVELSNSDMINRNTGSNESNGLGLKRKWRLEDQSDLKRTKFGEAGSGLQERTASVPTNNLFSCSFMSKKTTKRTRDDEMVGAYPVKKIK